MEKENKPPDKDKEKDSSHSRWKEIRAI